MQRPTNVTPTKMPSFGAIVRLFSFTGHLRGVVRRRNWRNMSRHGIVNPLAFCYEAGQPLRRSTKGRRHLGQPGWRGKLVETLRSGGGDEVSRPEPTPKCQIGRSKCRSSG